MLRRSIWLCVVLYLTLEIIFSYRYLNSMDLSRAYYTDSGKTYQFDPISGTRVGNHPSKASRITYGVVEFVGKYQGNNCSLPSDRDYEKEKAEGVKRFAVLGDSFSMAEHFTPTWPDRLHEILGPDRNAEIINISTFGAGVGNFLSILKFRAYEEFDVDAVIFAINGKNVNRTFTFMDFEEDPHPKIGFIADFDLSLVPEDRMAARPFVKYLPSKIISESEFDRLIVSRWFDDRQVKPVILSGLVNAKYVREIKLSISNIKERLAGEEPEAPYPPLTESQSGMITEIAGFLSEKQIESYVVYYPQKKDVFTEGDSREIRRAREFSTLIGARFVDGRRHFRT